MSDPVGENKDIVLVMKHIDGGPVMATQHEHWHHLVPPGGQEGGDTQGKPHCDRLPSPSSSHVRVINHAMFQRGHPRLVVVPQHGGRAALRHQQSRAPVHLPLAEGVGPGLYYCSISAKFFCCSRS